MVRILRFLRHPIRFGVTMSFCLLIVVLYIDRTTRNPEDTYLGIVLTSIFDPSIEAENFPRSSIKQLWEDFYGGKPNWFDCEALIDEDEEVLEHYNDTGRLTMDEPPILAMECKDIKARVVGNQQYKKIKHPYAIARNVFHHYYIQEVLLSLSYSPYNFYCYAVDKKANISLVESLNKLASCLPNVVVIKQKYPFNSAGHHQDEAHLACMKALLAYSRWEYVLLLQSHDIVIKTPSEISTILGILDGMPLIDLQNVIRQRVPRAHAWTPRALKLFKPNGYFSLKQEISKMAIRKSTNQCFLSRDFSEEIIDRLDFQHILNLFNNKRIYGVDEMLLPTIIGSAFMGFPGQIENFCTPKTSLRYVHWENLIEGKCRSRKKRHDVCILGVEYLPKLATVQALFANKIWPSVDFGVVFCIGEMLYNRSSTNFDSIDRAYYSSLPQVREKIEKKYGIFDPATFEC